MTIFQVDYADGSSENFEASKVATGVVDGFLELLDDEGKTVAMVNQQLVRSVRMIRDYQPDNLRAVS